MLAPLVAPMERLESGFLSWDRALVEGGGGQGQGQGQGHWFAIIPRIHRVHMEEPLQNPALLSHEQDLLVAVVSWLLSVASLPDCALDGPDDPGMFY